MVDEAAAGLGGGTLWMMYSAFWRHAPVKFPRKLDDWWGWFRGTNQEIAAQHTPSGSNIPADPITPVDPAKEGK